ncbi:putative Ig domain-containing protein [Methylicorpusculum oleiharenae]|uniref:calcium-binding protein n=1 Tax=Methylicorpusculum oleiharenae TaxID=1338687 RepID=UPI00135CDA82|nr:calcium-binding protein [Methylicorpusculum oleiharenae]MCD2452583.1 putative Ig domain-containing protein [Methylicorpusculum oleiharenae]
MTNVAKVFELAQLAEASYANFIALNVNLKDELKNASFNDMAFSISQADEFALHWKVVSHQPDTDSGFSATLFQRIDDDPVSGYQADQFFYAIRGTAGNSDLLGADLGDIVQDGLALDQLVDLYNDWQRLNSIAGQSYQAAELTSNTTLTTELQSSVFAWAAYNANPLIVPMPTELTPEQLIASWRSRSDIVIDLPNHIIRTIEFKDSRILFTDERAFGSKPDGFSGQLTEVTGHSLGGHLAAAFTRLFPNTGAEAVTINAAGFGGDGLLGIGTNANINVANLFSMLGGNFDFTYDSIHNLFGDKMPEFITQNGPGLFQKGSHDPLFIEQSKPSNYTFGHGAGQMTDSLAVANLFVRLDPILTNQDPATALLALTELFQKSSNQVDQSLENSVSALTEFILGSKPAIITDNRNDLYSAINNLIGGTGFKNLIGQVRIVAPAATSSEARADFGLFLSLVHLTPFALKPNSYEAKAFLQSASSSNTELGLQWEQDNLMTAEQQADGEAHYSDMWLSDRAHLLEQLIRRNTADSDMVVSGVRNETFQDLKTGQVISTAGIGYIGPDLPPDSKRYIFGDDSDNSDIQGGTQNDHLYGGTGDDTLNGNGGNDYLEGGTGNDSLNAGSGADKLLGGSGNDILEGGQGNDRLIGGQGHDTYIYHSGDGFDTIEDSDGLGSIIVNDVTLDLTSGKKIGTDVWESADQNILVVLGAPDQNGQRNLYINGSIFDGGRIMIKNFHDGDLGLTLPPSSEEPTSTPVTLFLGDSQPGQPDMLIGTFGDDYMVGGVDRDILEGWNGDDVLFADQAVDLKTVTDYRDFGGETANGQYGDFLSAGSGNDILIGSAHSDALMGGEGDDLILGGAGHDIIYGDATYGTSNSDWTYKGLPEMYQAADPSSPGWNNGTGLSPVMGSFDTGLGGQDRIYGGSGGDLILAGQGDDIVYGESGMDSTDGGAGHDILFGGEDDDSINGDIGAGSLSQHGNDYIDLGSGIAHQYARGNGGNDIILGGDTDDTLEGDDLRGIDVSAAYHGSDYIDGKGGNDTIWGHGGDDTIYGGEGDDYIEGDAGTEFIAAQYQGNDYLDGEAGHDTLFGGGGDDEIYGGSGNDLLIGDGDHIDLVAHGHDFIDGGEGNDELHGGGGSDYLDGGSGDDKLLGGAGDDILIGGSGTNFLDGGEGADTYKVGQGEDVITDADTNNRIVLNETTQLQAISLATDGAGQQDLLLTFANGARVSIKQGFLGAVNSFVVDGAERNLSDLLSVYANQNLALKGTDAAEHITSGAGNDFINGNAGNDWLDGGRGNDVLQGGAGSDTLRGGQGADVLAGGSGSDVYWFDSGDGADVINSANTSDSAGDVVYFGKGIEASGLVFFQLANGSLLLRIGDGQDSILFDGWFNEGPNVSALHFYDDTQLLASEMTISSVGVYGGTANNDRLIGTEADDRIEGYAGNDVLSGGAGNDILAGGAGNDSYLFGWGALGNDVAEESSDASSIIALTDGTSLRDLKYSRVSNDLVMSLKGGASTLMLKDYFTSTHLWTILDESGISTGVADWVALPQATVDLDQVKANFVDTALAQWASELMSNSTFNYLRVDGSSYRSSSVSADSATIRTEHFKQVEFVSDAAEFQRSSENKTYSSSTVNVVNTSPIGEVDKTPVGQRFVNIKDWTNLLNQLRMDDANTSLDAAMPVFSGFNILGGFLIGASPSAMTQYWQTNQTITTQVELIQGGNSDNTIRGYRYYGDNSISMIDGGSGNDTLYASGRPGLNNETNYFTDIDTFIGGFVYGNAGDDSLYGGYYRDTLVGGEGNDFLDGGFSQDTYVVFADESGIDTIWDTGTQLRQSIGYRLGFNTPGLVLEGGQQIVSSPVDEPQTIPEDTLRLIAISPNALTFSWGERVVEGIRNNGILGSTGTLLRDGTAVSNQSVHAVLSLLWAGGGVDIVLPNSTDLSGMGLERIEFGDGTVMTMAELTELAKPTVTLNPQDEDNILYGLYDSNTLYGEAGNDQLHGGIGNDFLSGGSGDDALYGGDGHDELNGGAGTDTMTGGTGNDTYVFGKGSGQDWVNSYDTTAGKIDTVQFDWSVVPDDIQVRRINNNLEFSIKGSSDSLTIFNYLENDGITPYSVERISFFNGTVWDLAVVKSKLISNRPPELSAPLTDLQVFEGEDFLFSLDGTAFNDPDDGDSLTYSAGLADGSDLPQWLVFDAEALTFSGIADKAGTLSVRVTAKDTGNLAVSDIFDLTVTPTPGLIITGNSGADSLIGGRGDDVLNGLAGNDKLYGYAGNDVLNGGIGHDIMAGGIGDDIYIIDSAGDTVIENADEGFDKVESSVTYKLNSHVEQLQLKANNAINATGNELDNVLIGNEAANILNGGIGKDTLIGGRGNDTYSVDNASDTVIEYVNEGIDLVQSSVSFTLTEHIENLTLTGNSSIDGTGNELNNVLRGNIRNNSLIGGGGNDLLYGGRGNDLLDGGTGDDYLNGGTTGSDRYLFGRGSGKDIIDNYDTSTNSTDTLSFGNDIKVEQLWFRKAGRHLEVSIIGSNDKTTINNWYSSKAYRVEQFKTADEQTLLSTQVDALVSAMAAFAPPAAGETVLPPDYQAQLTPVIAANWQ